MTMLVGNDKNLHKWSWKYFFTRKWKMSNPTVVYVLGTFKNQNHQVCFTLNYSKWKALQSQRGDGQSLAAKKMVMFIKEK